MDFGYQLCLLISFFFFSISFFLRQLERLNCNEELIGASAQRLSELSPTRGATLSHAPMRGAFCSTVLLLLPFLHSLALAGAGTRREARAVLQWIPTTCVCSCQVPPSPVTSLGSPWRVRKVLLSSALDLLG